MSGDHGETLPDRRPEIEYPTSWTYKVIGRGVSQIEEAVRGAVEQRQHTLEASRRSAGGRYVSMTLQVEVESDAARIGVFEALQRHDGVSWVL